MTNAVHKRNKERNLRYILAKLPEASDMELDLIAAFIGGLGICGWSDTGAAYKNQSTST